MAKRKKRKDPIIEFIPVGLPPCPTDLDFEKDLEIERLALDEEWLRQPNLVYNYNLLKTYADLRVRQAERNLRVVKAELAQKARSAKNKNKLSPPLLKDTDQAVNHWIRLQPKYEEAYHELDSAIFESDAVSSACKSISTRGFALSDEVTLFLNNYFSTDTSVSGREYTKRGEEITDQGISEQRLHLRNKMRRKRHGKKGKGKK